MFDDMLEGLSPYIRIPSNRHFTFIHGLNTPRTIRIAKINFHRALKAGVDCEPVDIGRLYEDRRGICGICRMPVPKDVFTVDHIRPISRGGVHRAWNLQLAHQSCNTRKRDHVADGFGVFHKRPQRPT